MALPQLPLGKAHKIPATPSAAAPKAKGALGETLPQTQRFVKRQERRAARQKEQAAGAGWLTLVRTGIVAVVAIAALLVTLFLVLRVTPLFTITSIEADPTTHITAQDIANLTKLDANATLLNYNASELEASLKKNPWVKSVSFTAEFPSTLKITIEEREAFAICVATTSDKAWYLSMQGTWIEPVSLTAAGDTTLAAAALEKAGQEGLVLIQNLSSMSPVAGEETDDAAILACLTFEDELSESLRSQIVSYSAASSEAISCTLSSGVEISLGAATNIASKETVITSLLEEYPGQLTYINVRIPSKPSYRKIASDSVQAGSGVITQQEEQS
jgi:cell division protein FtsQ